VRSLIPARIDRLPWSSFHTRMVVALGVAWILDGLEIQIATAVSAVLNQRDTLNLSSTAVGLITTVYLVGEVVGALVFGRMLCAGHRVDWQSGVHERDVVAVVLGHREVDVGPIRVRVKETAVEGGVLLIRCYRDRCAPRSGWLRGQPDDDRTADLLHGARLPGCDSHHFPAFKDGVVAD
jgi:hypothetical protein